ncbi:MAG: dual specificity protein phosphatase family protein [Chloroflexi bacterium]|nr:dual specificity protein phosphatase family protein [Chloroflexota bacterium]
MLDVLCADFDAPRRPLPGSYWVLPGRLLAGESPGAVDRAVALRKLRRVLAAGVTLFIDLTEPGEYAVPSYAALLPLVAPDAAITHVAMPIRDQDVPTPAEMRAILDLLDNALAREQCVYVHCRGGVGRTGTVIGCYLVRHGLAGPAALDRLAHLRLPTPDRQRPSPATEAQRALVLGWSRLDTI